MTKKFLKPHKLYQNSFFFGLLFMIALMILVCTIFKFDYKSAVCVYLYGGLGYTLKALIFFLPYFLLNEQDTMDFKYKRQLTIWSPLILFVMWFLIVIFFQVEAFTTDISFGYIMRFPHFILQLLSVLITCIWASIRIERQLRKANIEEEIE